jgi:hypothetical protein
MSEVFSSTTPSTPANASGIFHHQRSTPSTGSHLNFMTPPSTARKAVRNPDYLKEVLNSQTKSTIPSTADLKTTTSPSQVKVLQLCISEINAMIQARQHAIKDLNSTKKSLAYSQSTSTPLRTSNIVGSELEKENVSPLMMKLPPLSPEKIANKLTFGLNEYEHVETESESDVDSEREKEKERETQRETTRSTGKPQMSPEKERPIQSDLQSVLQSPETSFSLSLNDRSYLDEHNKVPTLEKAVKVWQLKANLITQEMRQMKESMEMQFREKDQKIREANDAKNR